MNPEYIPIPSSSNRLSPGRRGTPAGLVAALILLGLGGSVSPLSAQDNPLDVGVRASVPDKTTLWSKGKYKLPGEGGHSKCYQILAINEVESENSLIKPVDEDYLKGVLVQALNANGFHPPVAGEDPDIVLTCSYGRGELANPYIRDQGEVGGGSGVPSGASRPAGGSVAGEGPAGGGPSGGFSGGDAPTQTITGAFSQQLFDEKTPGWEAKLQKASYEKLYLRVTAFQFPKGKTDPTRMLWKTIMVVDDPDHRDLNDVMEKMLEAGAPFFDKEPKDKEVDIFKPLPTGHVNVGTPEVIEPSRKKSK